MTALIQVPSGKITLRDPGNGQTWAVQLSSFALGITPVTQVEFARMMGRASPPEDDQQKPQVEVSWFEAVEYCNRLSREEGLTETYVFNSPTEVSWNRSASGYRLPTEAEWEYACRADADCPDQRYGELQEIAWYGDNSGARLHRAGLKQPNEWGLYDMLGNVWEWCWDLFDPEIYGEYRVFRGGGWADEAQACRAGARRKSHPTFSIDDLGFRVARSFEDKLGK